MYFSKAMMVIDAARAQFLNQGEGMY